jgi:cytochrome c peroxidase
MKKTNIGMTATMLVIAVTTLQCSKTDRGPATLNAGAEVAGGTADSQSTDVLSTIEAKRAGKELVVLMPCEATKQLEADLKARNVPVRVLRDQSRNPQYYANQLIPHLRKQESKSIWFVFDNTDKAGSDALQEHFFSVQKATFRSDFGNLTLTRIVNELVLPGPEPFVSLELVHKSGGTITNILFAPDGETMYLAYKHGVVRWHSITSKQNGTSLKLPRGSKGKEGAFSGGESGLVGFVFHPDFPTSRKVYLHYNWQLTDGTRQAVVSEWDMNAKHELENQRTLMVVPQPRTDHNGGQLLFGPKDGYLYIAIGDGGEGKHTIGRAPAHTYRGKVHRIDPATPTADRAYSIPADNPFLDHPELPPETYAWGFRNPWRMCFLPDGRLIAGDIGEDVNEEITFVVKGSHHGWPYVEGQNPRNRWTLTDQTLQPTLLAYNRKMGMSVIGGAYYSSDELPDLQDRYVWCDFISGRIWCIDVPESTGTSLTINDAELVGQWPLLFTTFGKDLAGKLYVGTNTGSVYRLVPPSDDASIGEDTPITALEDSVAQGMFATEMSGPTRDDASDAEVALGRKLYSDKRLSSTGQISCASCHNLENYGQDGKQLAGIGARNTPTTFNSHRQFAQLWDYRTEAIEDVAAMKFITTHGIESEAKLAAMLKAIPEYAAGFKAVFATDANPITAKNASTAVGAFLRKLTTRSRWDDYLEGNSNALTADEKLGLATFVEVGCVTCHQFRGLGGSMSHKMGLLKPWTGHDRGRALLTNEPSEDYYFKVPPLYNIDKTGPYFHDGSVKTLEEAVRVMADIQLNRQISDEKVNAMVTFLRALTGDMPAIAK